MSRRPPIPVALALGSNVGDRESHLSFAIDRLQRLLSDMRVSSWHETEPVDVDPQPLFLNGAVTGFSTLTPRALLDELLQIERDRGRERPHAGAPRTLDLDLIFYGDAVVDDPGVRVPHPRFRHRRFVLGPLAEIAPHWRDPETGLTVAELLQRQKAQGKRPNTKEHDWR